MKKFLSLALVGLLSLGSLVPAQAARTGAKCTKLNAKSWDGNTPIVCKKKSKGKLKWIKFGSGTTSKSGSTSSNGSGSVSNSTPSPSTPSPQATSKAQANLTFEQINAVAKAKTYLNSSSFSRSGLIKQLVYEGFSEIDSEFAVDSQNVDWRNQAVLKSRQYLNSSGFSYSGLLKQMQYEGFNNEQAIFGIDSQKADWFDQAVRTAAQYLKSSSFSRTSLIKQLEYEGFSNAEAIYGTDSNGFASTLPSKPGANPSPGDGSNSSPAPSTSTLPALGRIIGGDNWSAYEIKNQSTSVLTHPSFSITTSTSTGAIILEFRNDKFPMLKAGETTWMYMPGSAPGKIAIVKYPRSSNRPTNMEEWPLASNAKVAGTKFVFTLTNRSKKLRLTGESIFYAFCLNSSGIPVLAEQSKTWTTLLPGGTTEVSWPTMMNASECSSILVNIGAVYE